MILPSGLGERRVTEEPDHEIGVLGGDVVDVLVGESEYGVFGFERWGVLGDETGQHDELCR